MDGIHLEAFAAAVTHAQETSEPVCVLAITSALVAFFDWCAANQKTFALPSSSRILDTGGNKGKGRPLSRNGYLQSCWKYLKVAGYYCVNEYGMTEMASQFTITSCTTVFGRATSGGIKSARPGHARWSSILKPWKKCHRASTASCVTLTWPTAARSWRFRPMT